MLVLLGVCMVPCLMSYAQTQAYADYPQTRGGVEQWKQEDFPSWLSLDGQIRLRTEQQTSYQYISGNDRIYELTRVYGGLTVRPHFVPHCLYAVYGYARVGASGQAYCFEHARCL